jgi:predicted HNH restriction endonuclease
MQNRFEKWLKKKSKSQRQANTIKTISNDLKKVNYKDYDIFSINDLAIAKRVKDDYFNIDEYSDKNARGHSMYNSAFNRYIEFLESENYIPMNAFFENGVYESVLEEIIEAQKQNKNIICYIQPYSTAKIEFLSRINPSKNNPITFYISTTSNLNSVSYTAEIIGWEDKRVLFAKDADRVEELNKHINMYQADETNIYKYSDKEETKECANLISIRNLRKLSLQFSVSMLTRVNKDLPLTATRTQAGGWSEVYKLENIEKPIFIEDVNEELEKKIIESRLMSSGREERLEKSSKVPEEIQVISRGFKRNADVVVAVLDRANGFCEKCESKAPFIRKKDNTPYLEVHHKILLAEGGEDSIENAIAVCPNCHRELHFGI